MAFLLKLFSTQENFFNTSGKHLGELIRKQDRRVIPARFYGDYRLPGYANLLSYLFLSQPGFTTQLPDAISHYITSSLM